MSNKKITITRRNFFLRKKTYIGRSFLKRMLKILFLMSVICEVLFLFRVNSRIVNSITVR